MSNVRPLNKNKYNISKHKFLEIYHYCLQYNEWVDELKYNTDSLKAQVIEHTQAGVGKADTTAKIAIRRGDLLKRCELVEQTAIEADPDIYQYILKAVTNERISFNYLKNVMGIPCGKDMYYDRRRKFYYLMSSKKT